MGTERTKKKGKRKIREIIPAVRGSIGKQMKEFVMQETEEMTTFGSVWKRYEPVAELVRCKDCKFRYTDSCITKELLPDYFFCWQGTKKD